MFFGHMQWLWRLLGWSKSPPQSLHLAPLSNSLQHIVSLLNSSSPKMQPCPCCGAFLLRSRFLRFNGRKEAMCPVCKTVERHRAACFNLAAHGLVAANVSGLRPTRVLHFGPEPAMVSAITAGSVPSRLQHRGVDFFHHNTGRYDGGTEFADVRALTFPANHFDVIIAVHVLEHVDRIKTALGEIKRVLAKPHGTAILEVPCWNRQRLTVSIDCRMDNATGRRTRCGQEDHVWRFACSAFEDMLRLSGLHCRDSKLRTTLSTLPPDVRKVGRRVLSRSAFPQYLCTAGSAESAQRLA